MQIKVECSEEEEDNDYDNKGETEEVIEEVIEEEQHHPENNALEKRARGEKILRKRQTCFFML